MRDLTVAAAQIPVVRGDLDANLAEHLRCLDVAARHGVHLVIFPELSLTGYELDLAHDLQLDLDAPALQTLQDAATRHGLTAVVGGPWRSGRARPYLAAFVIEPDGVSAYAKIHVHSSESPYVMPGTPHQTVDVHGVSVGLAICADLTRAEHADAVAGMGCEIYAAGVMKVEEEYAAHGDWQRRHARTHGMVTLTANFTGHSGGWSSAGRSALWDPRGELVVQGPPEGRALVMGRRIEGVWTGEVVAEI